MDLFGLLSKMQGLVTNDDDASSESFGSTSTSVSNNASNGYIESGRMGLNQNTHNQRFVRDNVSYENMTSRTVRTPTRASTSNNASSGNMGSIRKTISNHRTSNPRFVKRNVGQESTTARTKLTPERASRSNSNYEQNRNIKSGRTAQILNKSNRVKPPLTTNIKFGFKCIENMVNHKDSDEIITYICDNADIFEVLLTEKPRTDLLYLLMKLLIKTIDTKFGNSKLMVYSMVCDQTFIDHLVIQTTNLLTANIMKLDAGCEFIENVMLLINDIMNLLPNKAVESVDNLLTVVHMVVNSLSIGHPKASELLKEIDKLREQMKLLKDSRMQQNNNTKSKKRIEKEPPNDFRELDVYPTSEDFKEKHFLRENVIEGSYDDIYHYLDVHFRLIREDFIEPLREGIQTYRDSLDVTNEKRKKNFNIRIYRGVKFLNVYYDEKKPGEISHVIQMDKKFSSKIRWDYSKRLIFGSLLLFSSDNFEHFQIATVFDRKLEDLKAGNVKVKLVGGNIHGNDIWKNTFVMAESTAYYEPVYQVLNTFKSLPIDELPMENYLLVKNINPVKPQYLQNNSRIEIANHWVSIDDDSSWPDCQALNFNQSQCDALKATLRNEFVVIQGPPGTGKTYFGLNLVKILLKNCNFNSPILMVCYTNHALDQFLEGLMDATDAIIRIGGQSKNEALAKFNYQNVRGRHHMKRHPSLAGLKESMSYCLNEISSSNKVMSDIQNCDGILNLVLFKNVELEGIGYFEDSADYLSWLLGDLFEPLNYILQVYKDVSNDSKKPVVATDEDCFEDEDDDGRSNFDEELIELDFSVSFNATKSVQLCLTIEKLNSLKYCIEQHISNSRSMVNHEGLLEKQFHTDNLTIVNNVEAVLSTRLKQSNIKPSRKFTSLFRSNLWELSENDRWAVYHYWIEKVYSEVSRDVSCLQTRYTEYLDNWREIKVMEDYSTITKLKPKILGLTTTGAARHHTLLQALKSPIIIVEEAAEVLEAHIVVALTKSCQHLILIGDHKQLKPNPSTFKIAKKYHLEVSLFERMLLNGIGCNTLNVQHRMKPNIASLIAPTIYPDLTNHPSVNDFPPVKGISKNLFFINHKEFEAKDEDVESHFNPHEAKFTIALCRHLLLQGYKPSDITILTTYSSQQFYFRDLKKKNPLLKEVRMTAVDNYQGEECNIILLSLVRSNSEGKIGFLGVENRVCVALSRAKHGLYVIGNMDLLKSKSDLWTTINDKLEKNEAIGEKLSLTCPIHHKDTRVSCARDFDQVMEGGCNLTCNRLLACGHDCQSLCHVIDLEHKQLKCCQPCLRKICHEPDHSCPLKCYKPCQPCEVLMRKSLPDCEHEATLPCHMNPADYKCRVEVKDKKLDCNHEVERHCFQDIRSVKCQVPCKFRLDCGHACTLKCHVNDDPEHLEYRCMKDCVRINAGCKKAHQCKKRCYEDCSNCVVKVDRKIDCGHNVSVNCSMDLAEIVCPRDCSRTMLCGHKCKRKCPEPCGGCKVKVSKTILGCNHTIQAECSAEVNRSMCRKPCQRLLTCGHRCLLKCSQDCSLYKCLEYIPSPVKPACGHQGFVICSKANEINDPNSDNLLKYCKEKCGKDLPCKDKCNGTCGSCMQGRIHQVCMNPCGNILICGHKCSVPCRENCPPCKEKCLYKCEHSVCPKQCGVPCVPCKEKCSWSCKHLKCTKLCSEFCNREPCYEACDQLLKCGHPCVGFCGEPCPPLCRFCHREELISEFCLGYEEEEDARFVLLIDCQHSIESVGLEYWLQMKQDEKKDEEIGVKCCPRCRTPITKTLRFSNLSKRNFKLVQKVKEKIFGRRNEIDKLQKDFVLENFPKITKLVETSPEFVFKCRNLKDVLNIVEQAYLQLAKKSRSQKHYNLVKFGVSELSFFNFICNYLINIIKVTKKLTVFSKDLAVKNLYHKIENRFDLLMYHLSRRQKKISLMEIQQFQSELNRFIRIIEFYGIIKDFYVKRGFVSDIEDKIKRISDRFFSLSAYDYDAEIVRTLKDFSIFCNVLFQPLSEEEKKMINNAMSKDFYSATKQGHWFTCSKGHLYVITECGGAMTTGVCPECKEVIGGSNHSTVSTSRLSSEMDGARYPAWSNQQNMLNFQL